MQVLYIQVRVTDAVPHLARQNDANSTLCFCQPGGDTRYKLERIVGKNEIADVHWVCVEQEGFGPGVTTFVVVSFSCVMPLVQEFIG